MITAKQAKTFTENVNDDNLITRADKLVRYAAVHERTHAWVSTSIPISQKCLEYFTELGYEIELKDVPPLQFIKLDWSH